MDKNLEDSLAKLIKGTGRMNEAQRHLLLAPAAKRVRPKFVLACGELGGVDAKDLYSSATAVELMHAASLLHDDIVDEARERRGRPSVNALYGNHASVMIGDRLLALALQILTKIPHSTLAVGRAADTMNEMTEAFILEAELRETKKVTEEDVLKVADGKTGALFALSGYLGGIASGDEDTAERLWLAGKMAGRAFQIRDDIDDLEEDSRDGTPTLPQIIGSSEAQAAVENALREAVEALEPYSDQPAYQDLIQNIYTLARTPLPVLS